MVIRANKITTSLDAYHPFDEMSSHSEVFTGGVLRVTVHYVYYLVTEETLQQVFAAYGMVKISVSQRIDHVEAVVQLRSRHGAVRGLALHDRCIFERACLLDIQDLSPVAPLAMGGLGELCEQIRGQLQELSEMIGAASWSSTPTSQETTTADSPELTAPVEHGADYGVVAIDTNSLAAPWSITCSTECPSREATIDIFPEPSTSTPIASLHQRPPPARLV